MKINLIRLIIITLITLTTVLAYSYTLTHPILDYCLYKKTRALEEYMTLFQIGWIKTVENKEIIWKLTEHDRALLFYKISVMEEYGSCLERGIIEWELLSGEIN